jgi:hypothetical protein
MAATVTISPWVTSTPSDSFVSPTQGYIAGLMLDDPVSRMWLNQGVLASTETVPLWGGVPIAEYINLPGTGASGLGPTLKRATASIAATGWCVFNQAMSGIITTSSTAPSYVPGGSVNFVRFGSNARIVVAIDPAIVTAVNSTDITVLADTLYWDVTNYRITTTSTSNAALPTTTAILEINTNSKLIAYTSATGTVAWTTGTVAVIEV